MKKRILAMIMALSMAIGLLPMSAFAVEESYRVGDSFTADIENATLPSEPQIPDGTTWVYEGAIYEHEEHEHDEDCYSFIVDPDRCDGNGQLTGRHRWHTEDCYALINENCHSRSWQHDWTCYQKDLTCKIDEHTHDQNCKAVHTWVLVETNSRDQYRNWWPVYWDFDSRSSVRDSSVVTVTAGTDNNVKYSGGEVLSRTSLDDSTANTKNVLDHDLQITVAPGYYVSQYRLVCGNHTGCGVTGYGDSIVTQNTEGNYTSTLTYDVPASEFDHWKNIGGMHNNANSNNGVYQPTTKPSASADNIYHTKGQNTIYPFYLLIEVKQDTASYDIDYSWGALSLEAVLPDKVDGFDEYDNLPRNTEHNVLGAGAAALAEADALDYVFKGWKVESSTYADNIVVQPDSTVTVTGADILLVAQWEKKQEFTVTYEYIGEVPEGVVVPVDNRKYHENDTVTTAEKPDVPKGYIFTGWTSSDLTVSGDSFSMPAKDVTLVGNWSKDESATKTLSYTVKYWFNGAQDSHNHPDVVVTKDVWVNAPNTLTVKDGYIKTVEGYEFAYTDPEIVPEKIADGSIINVYYEGNNPDITVDKNVTYEDGSVIPPNTMVKVGDVLKYTITITNTGTHDFKENITITDTANGVSEEGIESVDFAGCDGTFAEGREFDTFTFGFTAEKTFATGASVSVTYTYTVEAGDAGTTLVNTAVWSDGNPGTPSDSDSTEVPVTPQYTLTVNYYLDEELNHSDDPITYNDGDNWTVTPKSIAGYAFDHIATTDALSGTISGGNVVVDLYYAKDEIGTKDPEKPDGVPDHYQAIVEYTTTTGGKIVTDALTKEVVTIYDLNAYKADASAAVANKAYAKSGVFVATGSEAAVADTAYRFANLWTLERVGHVSVNTTRTDLKLEQFQLPPNLNYEKVQEQLAVAGNTYRFTAVFEKIPVPNLSVDKLAGLETAKVGTELEYIIHVTNTGNVPLENVVINDFMSYVDGEEHSNIPNYRDNILELRVTGTEADNYVIEQNLGSITIKKLAIGQIISVEYVYEVQAADAGETIHNVADAKVTADVGHGGTATVEVKDEETVKILDQHKVSYVLKGDIPEDLESTVYPENTYSEGDIVAVMEAPVYDPESYGFTGWVSEEVTPENNQFTMPNQDVVFVGTFTKLAADIDVTKTVYQVGNTVVTSETGIPTAQVGDTIQWTITVTNNGNAEGKYSLQDKLAGVTVCDEDGKVVHATDVHSIAVKETQSFTAKYVVKDVEVSDTQGIINTVKLSNGEEAGTDPVPYVDLDVTEKKLVGESKVFKIGETVMWDVTIKNNGTADTTISVDDLKAKLFDSIQYKTGDETYENLADTEVQFVTSQMQAGYNIDAGESITVPVKWTIPAGTEGMTIRNVAQIDDVPGDDKDPEDVIPSDDVTIGKADLDVTKVISKVGNTEIKYGSDGKPANLPVINPKENGDTVIQWTITVTNSGDVEGKFTLTDTLKDVITGTTMGTLTIAPALGDGETSYSVEAKDSNTYTVTYTATANDAGKRLVNTVVITPEGENPRPEVPSEPVDVAPYKVVYQYTGEVPTGAPEEPVDTKDYQAGDAAVMLDAPTFHDYTFSGWTTEDADVDNNGNFKVNSNVLFTGSWTKNATDIDVTKKVVKIGDTEVTDQNNIPVAEVGDVIEWEITIQYVSGPQTMVTLKDVLDIGSLRTENLEVEEYHNVSATVSTHVITATYTVQEEDRGQLLTNTAVTTMDNGYEEKEPAPGVPVEPDLSVSKTVAKVGGTAVSNQNNIPAAQVGDTIEWTIVVKNEGAVDGTVTLKETLSDGRTVTIKDASGATVANNSEITVKAGETQTYTVTYTAVSGDKGDTLKNTVILDDNDGKDDDPKDESEDVDVKKPHKPNPPVNPPALNTEDHYAYIIGYPDGNVKPNGSITRAEVATIFFRLLTDESRDEFWSTTNEYSDVSAEQWFNNAISTLSNAGIINGYEDGTFRPNAPITRAEFAKIAVSFFSFADEEYKALYPDVPEGKWYAKYVEAASELGLITGYPDGTFRPEQDIIRAEACTIVNRTIDRHPHEDQLHEDMIVWPDNPAPSEAGHQWYYEQIQEATNSHEYVMKDSFEDWTDLLENRDWAAFEKMWSDSNSAPGGDVMK